MTRVGWPNWEKDVSFGQKGGRRSKILGLAHRHGERLVEFIIFLKTETTMSLFHEFIFSFSELRN